MSTRNKVEATLIPKSHLKMKSLTIRLPSDIMDRMQRIKDDADALGYVFDPQIVLTTAVIQALNRAESELEKILNQASKS